MKAASFQFYKPATVDEAVALLAEHGDFGKIIAGGQSLVPSMNFRLARPESLIDINGIAEISGIEEEADTLVIGALTRHAVFERQVSDDPTGALLTKVVQHVAHYPIRRRGTFGGSLSHADPASEWCLASATLGATMEIAGPEGRREVSAPDFFKGTFVTAISPQEILVRVRLPKLGAGWSTGFYEFSRRRGDFALAMSAAALKVEGGTITDARLGIGAVASQALRLKKLEDKLAGQPATLETVSAISAEVPGMVDPSADIHGSAEYRRELSGTVVRRALTEALGAAGAETGAAA